MGKTTIFTMILGFLCLNSNAQSGKYFGVRAQLSLAFSETSASISTKGGFGGGIGLAYLYAFNPNWEMTADATLSVFSLQSDERDFDFSTQTWTKVGDRKINFMTPEVTLTFNKTYGRNGKVKMGFGGFLSKNIQKTVVTEQANYWGNGTTIDDSFVINNNFLTGLNYGFCLESGVNLGIFRLALCYKQGLTNINTEGSVWRQSFLQLGATYFFGITKTSEFKHQLDDIQPYSF
jgi:hypothetical protein